MEFNLTMLRNIQLIVIGILPGSYQLINSDTVVTEELQKSDLANKITQELTNNKNSRETTVFGKKFIKKRKLQLSKKDILFACKK